MGGCDLLSNFESGLPWKTIHEATRKGFVRAISWIVLSSKGKKERNQCWSLPTILASIDARQAESYNRAFINRSASFGGSDANSARIDGPFSSG